MKRILLLIAIAFSITANAQPSYQSLLKDFRGKAIELNKVTKNVSDDELAPMIESNPEIKQKAKAVENAFSLMKKLYPVETLGGICETGCAAAEVGCFAFCHGQACAVCVLAYARCIANCGL